MSSSRPTKPKKRARDLAQTRRDILNAAFDEIYTNGFHASSLDAILERTELTKGALFHQFASKLELGYAVVDEIIVPMTRERWITPLEEYDDPLRGILDLVERNVVDAPAEELHRGCPLGNLIQEMSNTDAEFRRRLRRCVEVWIEGVAEHVERGRRAGHVRRSVKPRAVGEYVVVTLEGLFAVVKGMRDKTVVPASVSSMRTYLRGLAPDSR
ncbi:MAG TPA: TetR/AcrR family transcriptional regulator [Polyangiaceae bacterium]|jgi:AcrR family transcriptional regulator